MSRKSRNDNATTRRSALSFIGVNGSLDIDHVLQCNPWKDVETFEQSEAACIQNILNNFDNKITQEKNLKAGDTIAKKSPRLTKKSPMKSPIETSTTDLFDTQLNTNSNAETTVNKKKRSTKSRQTSKKVEETLSQELACDIDNVKEKTSKVSAEENVDFLKQITQKEILHDVTNITKKNLQTSTPKKEVSKITKKTAKKGDNTTAENKKPKIQDSENKLKEDVQRKERQKISKKNMKDKQSENSTNMLDAEKKTNVKNNLCKVNQDTSTNKAEDKKEQSCMTLVSQMEKKRKVKKNVKTEINSDIEKNTKSKKYNKSTSKQLKKTKLEKENPENKLQKSARSNKSSRINNAEKKRQCKKNCAKYSDKQRCSRAKEHVEKMRQHRKTKKAARAIGDLNRRITVVKNKMKCIKNDLENSESSDSDSSYTDESSYSTYSSSSSYSSYSSTCSCSCCNSDDYTEYTLSSRDSSSSSNESRDFKQK